MAEKVEVADNIHAIERAIEQKSCFVLATNIDEKALSPEEVLKHYKAQSAVERGFRFLKDPLFLSRHFLLKSQVESMLY